MNHSSVASGKENSVVCFSVTDRLWRYHWQFHLKLLTNHHHWMMLPNCNTWNKIKSTNYLPQIVLHMYAPDRELLAILLASNTLIISWSKKMFKFKAIPLFPCGNILNVILLGQMDLNHWWAPTWELVNSSCVHLVFTIFHLWILVLE